MRLRICFHPRVWICADWVLVGIVTKFTMKTVSNKIWAQGKVVAPSNNDRLHKALFKYHEAAEKDLKAKLICNQMRDSTLLVFVYNESVEERPSVFDAFEEIEAVAQMVPPGTYTIYQMLKGVENVNATEERKYVFPHHFNR